MPVEVDILKIVSSAFARTVEYPAQRPYNEQEGYSAQYLLGYFRL